MGGVGRVPLKGAGKESRCSCAYQARGVGAAAAEVRVEMAGRQPARSGLPGRREARKALPRAEPRFQGCSGGVSGL